MPNWVYNEIRFKSEDDCKKVAELMKGDDGDFDFNNVIPIPEYLERIPGFGTTSHTRALAYAFSKGKQMTEREMEAAIKKAYPQIQDVAHTPKFDAWLEPTRDPYVLSKADVIELTRIADSTDYQNEIYCYGTCNKPEPYEEYAELVKRAFFETGHFDWYSWSLEHWGTKWNSCNPEIDIQGKRIYWETAWSPSPKIVAAIHEKTGIPMYYIYTEEQITVFAGEMIFKKGELKVRETDDPRECFQLAAFMELVDSDFCRISPNGDAVYENEDEWESATEITPEAFLEKEFLSM